MAVFRCGLRSGLRCRVGFWIIPRGRRGARKTGVARADVGRGQSSLGGSRVRTPYSPPVRPRRALSFHFWAHLVTMKRWRVDRVAEGVGLENQCVSNGTKGSNPLLSATSGKENPGTVEVPGFFCSHRPRSCSPAAPTPHMESCATAKSKSAAGEGHLGQDGNGASYAVRSEFGSVSL